MQVLSARLGLYSANPVAAGVAAYSGMLQTLAGLLGPAAANVDAVERLRTARLGGERSATNSRLKESGRIGIRRAVD